MSSSPLTRRMALGTLAGIATLLSPLARARRGHATAPMRIGMIGSGHVGETLGRLWTHAGHQVMFSARGMDAPKRLARKMFPLARAGTPADSALFGDVIVLAVPYGALPQLAQTLGRNTEDKVILDVTNPYSWRDGGIARLAMQQGAGITTRDLFPNSAVVRGLNSEDMTTIAAQAWRRPPRLGIPLAGDSRAALETVQGLIWDAGMDPVIVGPLTTAREFQPGGPAFEAATTAAHLREILNLPAATQPDASRNG
ncbi:NADPH-dependent F420 reductase [Novacetimonas hansenii]|uniref:NAD(P)-binding domain-containing protein n=1 Tax=Novacetimonas hansenii TaxID=436 RepID=A0AAW5ELE9_NOVHA|nr:NAD(P)-binding domain-containing protein [Novacetimonas hansenii]MCJ8352667.1 NAD(P)-binding domain-containing protein [Novacetimonas hansenii]